MKTITKTCGWVPDNIDDNFNECCIGLKIDKNSKDWYIHQILKVGQRGICDSEDFSFFLSNLTFLWDVSGKEVSTALLPDLIRGYHLIEMKKKEDNGNDFGFGSPSQTFYLINFLMKTDKDKAIDLYNWVAANDGNYYITSNVTYKENEENEKMRAKNRAIILLDDQKKHLEAVARKKIKQELHLKKSLEKIKPYPEFKKRFQKMNDEQLLDALKEEKGKQGFVKARGYFISYLREEIKIRGLD